MGYAIVVFLYRLYSWLAGTFGFIWMSSLIEKE